MNSRKMIPTVVASAGIIIGSIIGLEGGYSNHPQDTGKETMYGITESTARQNGYEGSMFDLPLSKATEIYQNQYIVVPNYDRILELSVPVGHKLIDAGVNVGVYRASLWFQKALNSFNRNGLDYEAIAEDGVIGPATVAAYKSLEISRGKDKACSLILKALDIQQGYHYLSLSNHKDFTVGWIDKRIQNVSVQECSG